MEQSLEVPPALKDLASAVSTQAQVVNKTWLALITISVYIIVRHWQSQGSSNLDASFLGLGKLDSKTYYLAAFLILTSITIAFTTAHAQQLRAIELAQRIVTALGKATPSIGNVSPRDLYDILREPGVSRIAPVAQMLRGKYQYDPESENCPAVLRMVTAGYYACLKLLVTGIYFVAPITAILICWIFMAREGLPKSVPYWLGNGLLLVLGLGSLVPAIQMCIADLMYIWRIAPKIGSAPTNGASGLIQAQPVAGDSSQEASQ